MFEIIYQQGDGERVSFRCENGSCTIGSDGRNDIVLDSKQISRVHARIESDRSGYRLDDMGSMAGTWVNAERIVSHGPLNPADEIIIGDYRLWFKEPTEEAKPAPVAQPAVEPSPAAGSTPNAAPAVAAKKPNKPAPKRNKVNAEMLEWRQRVHDKLIEQMDLRRKDVHSMSDAELRKETDTLLKEIIKNFGKKIPSSIDCELLHLDVLNEAVGLGPLEELLDDDSVTEIMVNSCEEIFVERAGKLVNSGATFTNDRAVMSVIDRIISPLGRRLDESSPMVDARLKDGSRVNAVIPPVAIKGPSMTIRKFSKERLEIDNLVDFNSVNREMADFLRVCVEQRRNVVVSGGTGSGKTTLLNVLSNFIPADERIVTAEDAAELQLSQPNLVSLESRPPNLEGRGAIAIRDLVVNSLRMRPDRIVVGECRGGEALDMLQAMNTGHDGSLTTAHANSPRDLLARLEVMVLMAGMDLPVSAIREQIASAVDIIVQQTRFPCGTRKVTYITEVSGVESNKIQLQDIFVYHQQGLDAEHKVLGRFEGCGYVPDFYEHLARIGMNLDLTIFQKPEGMD